ncbi:MAG: hypothetical protein ABW128_09945 [Rhizorhabdus sp.]
MTVLTTIPNGASGADVRDTINNIIASIAAPWVLIAAPEASAAVKKLANYVCTSDAAANYTAIQAVINAFPAQSVKDGANNTITTGVAGCIQFTGGTHLIGTGLSVPPGSTVNMKGIGASGWIPIGPATPTWDGGTRIYSTDPTGAVLAFPKTPGGNPASGATITGIDFVPANPAANVTGIAVNLDGLKTFHITEINVIADRSVNTTPAIATGLSIAAGGASSAKFLSKVNVYGFRNVGVAISTTHLMAIGISSGQHSNNAFSTCFNITPQDDNFLAGIQCFGCAYGISISNSFQLQYRIESVHFESITTPVLQNGSRPIEIGMVDLDTGVNFTGDITTKVRLGMYVSKVNPGKAFKNWGTATIAAGQTSVTWPHNLVAAPLHYFATPRGANGGFFVTADATNVTVTIPAALGAALDFGVQAWCGA